MTKKDLKQASKNNSIEKDKGKKLPESAFSKFIALPRGLKVKSGDNTEQLAPKKLVPVKAVPLCKDKYAQQIGVSSTYMPIRPEQREIQDNNPGSQQSATHRRTPSVSSVGSSNGTVPNGSIRSFQSDSSYTPRYRKRSSSTPPDVGRNRSSPVDKRIDKAVKEYYSNICNSVNNNEEKYKDGNLSPVNTTFQGSDPAVVVLDHNLNDDGADSLDSFELTQVLNNWDTQAGLTATSNLSQSNSVDDFNMLSPPGQRQQHSHSTGVHPHYLTLPRNTGGQVAQSLNFYHQGQIGPAMAYSNGTLPRGGGGRRPMSFYPMNSNQVILMGNAPSETGSVAASQFSIPNNRQGNLQRSRVISSSMPTLLDGMSKDQKRLFKEIRKQEEKERKRREKEEKKRLKEEKKLQKALKKAKTRTLPRNWAYVNKPIESVYNKPKLTFSAVPIDFEDTGAPPERGHTPAPSHAPPPPPQPSIKTQAFYSDSPDLLRLEKIYGATIRGVPSQLRTYATPNGRATFLQEPNNFVSEYAPRNVVLQKGPEGYGFVLRGAKSNSNSMGELDFCPTKEFPALQYLDSVEIGSRADKAGLKSGDFLLEINNENVVRSSHDRVVQLIRQSGDTLALKVVTVRPLEKQDNWLQHQDGSMTLPSRGLSAASKRQAPQPPRRDPQTSLSLTKTQGKQIAEGMAEIDKLDQALAEFDKQELKQEQKIASIRSSNKRVSLVDLQGIEGDNSQEKYMSPSEMRIKKYHPKKQNGTAINMERSKSTTDLVDPKMEPVYATPVVPGNRTSIVLGRRASASSDIADKYNFDAEDNVSLKSSASYGGSTGKLHNNTAAERPKAPPPPPPGGKSPAPKRQAPAPPPGVNPVSAAKTEMVSINTTSSTKIYASTTEVKSSQVKSDNPDFESSFRPGTSAKLTDEPKIKTKAMEDIKSKTHSRNSSVASKHSSHSDEASERHSVSFAEDKVFDNANTFMQKHPNAKLLVTADIHSTKRPEPEPDYDVDSEEEVKPQTKPKGSGVTVISVGDKGTTSGDKQKQQFSVKKSDIPSSATNQTKDFIPPPPRESAPLPPEKEKSVRPPSPKNKPPPTRDLSPGNRKSQILEVKVNSSPVVPAALPVAPAAPPPPAPPPPPPVQPPTELVITKKEENKPSGPPGLPGNTGTLLPTEDIMAAVEKRKSRIENEGLKITALPQKKQPSDAQAAILEAVARRRAILQQKSDGDVVDEIESRLNKSKKLQAAKFNSDFIKKEPIKPEQTSEPPRPKVSVEKKVEPEPNKPKVVTPSRQSLVEKRAETKPREMPMVIRSERPTSSSATEIKFSISQNENKHEEKKAPIKPMDKVNGTDIKVSSPGKEKASDIKGKDFLALAEKARQDYLRKRSGDSFLKDTKPVVKTHAPKGSREKSLSPTRTTPSTLGRSSKSPTPVFNSVADFSLNSKENGSSRINGHTTNNNADASKTRSIKDRIANFESKDNSESGRNRSLSPPSRYTVQGVASGSSPDRTSAGIPPPPGFSDAEDVIPPPSGFHPRVNGKDNDASSFVSSVSELSTLSDDNADSGYSPSKTSYDELIAPPPPGFDDGMEEPAVIPPPPDFDNNNVKAGTIKLASTNKPFVSKSVQSWQCLDVLDWLESLSMSQYKKSFQDNCIDGKKLLGLSRNDFIELGVTQVGHRMNLERSIKKAGMGKN